MKRPNVLLRRRHIYGLVAIVAVVSAFVLAPRGAQAQWNDELTLSDQCRDIRVVSGAGIRMRSEASADSKVLAILRYDTRLCVFTERSGWTEVSLGGGERRGWIQSQYLAYGNNIEQEYNVFFPALMRGDAEAALSSAERILEAKRSRPTEVRKEVLNRMIRLLEKQSDKNRALEWKARLAKLEKEDHIANGRATEFPNLFHTWFYMKFASSSQYDSSQYSSQVDAVQVLAILDEIEAEFSTTGGQSALFDRANSRFFIFFEKLYGVVFSDKAPPSYGVLKTRLLKPSFLVRLIPYPPEIGITGIQTPIVSTLPANILNDETVRQEIFKFCAERQLGPSWNLFEPSVVKENLLKYVQCIDEKNLVEALQKYKFLATYTTIEALLGSAIHGPKLAMVYSQLPESDRSRRDLIDRLNHVDIYRWLPNDIRKTKEARELATQRSSCENVVLADPLDREMILGIATRLTVECTSKIAKPLLKDVGFAANIVAKRPAVVTAFDESIQFHPKVFQAVVAKSVVGDCPYRTLPRGFPLESKRKLIGSNRYCLDILDTDDFKDVEIYKSVIDNELSFEVLKKLTNSFKSDPSVVVVLPARIRSPDETKLMAEFTGTAVLLDVAKKWGVAKLSKISASRDDEHPHFEYYYRWTPAEHVGQDFWGLLLKVSKQRGDSCSDWQKLVDSWALNVVVTKSNSDGSSSQSNPFGFPLYKLNNEFGCSIETSIDPVVH